MDYNCMGEKIYKLYNDMVHAIFQLLLLLAWLLFIFRLIYYSVLTSNWIYKIGKLIEGTE